MAISQKRSRRKATGGRYNQKYKQKQYELGSQPAHTSIGEARKKILRKMGGEIKRKLLTIDFANVYDPKTKKTVKTKILSVLDNPANRFYARRNIMTKGAVIQTEKGKARVASRPGQDGIVNAVLQ